MDLWPWLVNQANLNRLHPTPHEAKLWGVLSREGMGWEAQKPMILKGQRGKVFPMIWDFCCPSARLLVELDGRLHKAGPDGRRDRVCGYNGWTVLRFSNQRIDKDFENVLEEIHEAICVKKGSA